MCLTQRFPTGVPLHTSVPRKLEFFYHKNYSQRGSMEKKFGNHWSSINYVPYKKNPLCRRGYNADSELNVTILYNQL